MKRRSVYPATWCENTVTVRNAALWMFTRCLSMEVWQHKIDVNELIPGPVKEEFDPDALTFLRCFVSGASKCPLKQNRITIPQNLREDAGLQREVVLVGLLNKFEIWDKERWEEEFRRDKKRLQEASRSLKIHMRGLDDAVPSSTGPGS